VFHRKRIDEWALDYWLLQRYAKFWYRIFYRKIEVVNRHLIPENRPVILAPNHQNALMDAMVLTCNTEYQCVFLARADIFKGKMLVRFLTFANIMPVYRIRDGIENVKKNDEVFEKTVHVLRNKLNPLGIFPEGNHGDKRRLRNLVKGLFRIAFMAQEDYGDSKGVVIIPIGVDYGHYQNFRTTLFMNIGKPIEISDFMPVYRENPVHAINQLKERFSEALSTLMINIQTDTYYDMYMGLREIYNEEMRKRLAIKGNTLSDRFRADKVMIDMLNRELEAHPETIDTLNTKVTDYKLALSLAGLRDWVLRKKQYAFSGLFLTAVVKLVLLPVFIAGFITNWLPYWFTGSRARTLKDTQFHSSFKFVIGMIAFPVWYLVIAGILAFVPVAGYMKLIGFLMLPVLGLFAFHYYIGLLKFLSRFRYTVQGIRQNPEYLRMIELRKEILASINEIADQNSPIHEGKE